MSLLLLGAITGIYIFTKELRTNTQGKMIPWFTASYFTFIASIILNKVVDTKTGHFLYIFRLIDLLGYWSYFLWNVAMAVECCFIFWLFRTSSDSHKRFNIYRITVLLSLVILFCVVCETFRDSDFKIFVYGFFLPYSERSLIALAGFIACVAGVSAFKVSKTLGSTESFRFKDEMSR